LNCTDQIVPIAARFIRTLLLLPSTELREEVQVPVLTAIDKGVSISYVKKHRIRYGLGHLHDSKVHFRSMAAQVGAILAEHYNLAPLVQGAGPVLDTDQGTAGVRFLGRLIDAAIGGAEDPPPITPTLRRICRKFEAQLAAGKVEVEWIYPVPGLIIASPFQLSGSVRFQELGQERLELLHRYAEGGLVSHDIILQTATVLAIRATTQMPFGYTGRENSDVINKVVLAFILSDLPPPLFLTSWQESREPSVFSLGHAAQFALWSSSPLALFPQLPLSSLQANVLKRVYKAVDSCPEEVLNDLPMRRAVSAKFRSSYEDRLIDIWIALEALLLTDQETFELQYHMILRAAWLVQPPDLPKFKDNFKKVYTDRSKVVHGARHKIKNDTLERCEWVFSLLKQLLLISIREKRRLDPKRIEESMLTRRKSARTKEI
jgi:hypothetical protein